MLALLLAMAVATSPMELLAQDPRPTLSHGAAIRLSLSGDGGYRSGERVRVTADVVSDGYLLVFRVDGDGRIHVLFPLEPDLDPFVYGGRRYELRGHGARESFLADSRRGDGVVYAALSREPLNLARFAVGSRWDYDALGVRGGDLEVELTWLVRQVAPSAAFAYDMVGYRVHERVRAETQPIVLTGGGWYPSRANLRVSFDWYDPWLAPWYWGTGWSGWNGWHTWGGPWSWDPYWGRPGRPIPRYPHPARPAPPRPTVPNTIYRDRSRPNPPVPTSPRGRVTSLPTTQPRTGPAGNGPLPPTRSRPSQAEPTRARPSTERPATEPTTAAGAPVGVPSPQRPSDVRPASPTPNGGRARGPSRDVTTPWAAPVPRMAPPSVDRRDNTRPGKMAERPIYRPPSPTLDRPPVSPPTGERATPNRSRTVERPPAPRMPERAAPPREWSSPPRSTSPATRAAPPPSRPSAPPSGSSGRARTRPSGVD
jgi:hypothetical protein